MNKKVKTMDLLILSPVMIEGEMFENGDEVCDVPLQDAKNLIYREKAAPLTAVEEPDNLNDLTKPKLVSLAVDKYDLEVSGLNKA